MGSSPSPTDHLGVVPVSKGPPQAPCQIRIHPHHAFCIADVSRETTAPEIRHVGSHPESQAFQSRHHETIRPGPQLLIPRNKFTHRNNSTLGGIVCVLSLGLCGLGHHSTQPLDWASFNPQEPSQTFHLGRGHSRPERIFAAIPSKSLPSSLSYNEGTGGAQFPPSPCGNPMPREACPCPTPPSKRH